MSNRIVTPHDRFFKHAMSDLAIARAFFAQHLPTEIYQQLDWNSLKLQPGTFINKQLAKHETDVLFSVNFKTDQTPAYLYILVEHQSTVDHKIAWRLVQYTVKIIDQHLKRNKDQTLPLVIPLVFYAGNQPYTAPTDVYELFAQPPVHFMPFRSYALIDLTKITDAKLAAHQKTSLMHWIMKYVRQRKFMRLGPTLGYFLNQFFSSLIDFFLSFGVNCLTYSL